MTNTALRIGIAAAMLSAAAWLIAGPAGSVAGQEPAPTAEVKIDNFTFGPKEMKVAVGTTVTWTNLDDIPHTVVSEDETFKSAVLDTDDAFTYTFDRAGTYPYFCSIHPKMTGTVVVE